MPSMTTVAQAAQALGVSRQRIHQLIRSLGLVPQTQRAGGYVIWVLSEADMAKLAGRRTVPGPLPKIPQIVY